MIRCFVMTWGWIVLGIMSGCGGSAAPDRSETLDRVDDLDKAAITEATSAPDEPAEAVSVTSSSTDDHVCRDYVGSQSCASCHRERFDSFNATDHARSFRRPDSNEEVSLASWMHDPSGQRFTVELQEDEIRHSAWQTFPGVNARLPIADQPIQYVVGSGAFAKSYLYADGDALMQLPLTYYVGKQTYDMSPGYDLPKHPGFERQVSDQCLFCHVGQLERRDGNSNHSALIELAIGCERCHGGGRTHVETATLANQRAASDATSIPIAPMVHPDKISRSALEDLCAQCHLQGNVTMHPAGDDVWSYQAGDALAKTKIEYLVTTNPSETAFVGHFPQMRASACYQNSDTLQCVTCHDPHHEIDPEEAAATYRSQCLQCHDDGACGIEHEQRVAKNQNQCVICHMPRGRSEVPHVSITNHRIAVHPTGNDPKSANEPSTDDSWPSAIALLDQSPPESWQRNRNEAVAMATWVLDEVTADQLDLVELKKLIQTLRQCCEEASRPNDRSWPVVSEARLRVVTAQLIAPDASWRRLDQPIDAAEAERLRTEVRQHAQRALALQRQPMAERRGALALLYGVAFDRGDYADAQWHLESLVRYQRDGKDWYNLGITYARLGRMDAAESALLQAMRVSPGYDKPYASLIKLYSATDPARAAQLAPILRLLRSR